MREPVTDTLMFLNEHPKAVPLYACLEETVYELFPAVNKRVHKTQISFSNRRVFACVSFARVKRKAELPDPFIVLTRVAAKTEAYPGRWTTHLVVGSVDEIDEELRTWIRQACAFADSK